VLFARGQFGEVLALPRKERFSIIARHLADYRRGYGSVLVAWIVAALGYIMLAVLLRDAGEPIIAMLAAALFLLGIVSALVFWVLEVPSTLAVSEQLARTSIMPEYFEPLQLAADASLWVYQLLGLAATAGFGWALLQVGMLPSWIGWITLGWGVLWVGVLLRTSEGIPLLPMVMQLVIGAALLVKGVTG
jgi:hypothetical protein